MNKILLTPPSGIMLLVLVAGCSILSPERDRLPPPPDGDGFFRVTSPRSFPVYCSRSLNQCAQITDELQKKLIFEMCEKDSRFEFITFN